MVFAAGFGTRLLPWTAQTPKALLCIDNIPILKHIFNYYRHCAAPPFVINTHYLAEQFTEFMKEHSNYNICESFEKEILGTGKGLFFAKKYLHSEHFWLHNADILCDFQPQAMMNFHLEKKAVVTLAVCSTPATLNMLKVSKNNEVLGFEKFSNKTHTDYELKTFCGVHCISQKIFSLFSRTEEIPHSIIDLYSILLKKGVKICAWDLGASHWIDVGTPQKLEFARENKKLFSL
jgi:NDP-sugar pyrophosphorylase family protein